MENFSLRDYTRSLILSGDLSDKEIDKILLSAGCKFKSMNDNDYLLFVEKEDIHWCFRDDERIVYYTDEESLSKLNTIVLNRLIEGMRG